MRNKPARVYLFGGLGNQIFQYYFGIYLAITQNRDVIFDESLISVYGNNHGTKLSNFLNIRITKPSTKLQGQIQSLKFRILAKIQRNLQKKNFLNYAKTFVSIETGFVDIDFATSSANSYFGYFQSSKYFEKVGGRSIFHQNLVSLKQPDYSKKYKEIQNRNSVGIHIRRGDYVDLSQSYGILAIDYYEKALKDLGANRDSVLYVLSDDIDFAARFLSDLLPEAKRIYIDDLAPLESLLLFGQCQKICISNSTFGYWGALLGNPEVVVAPKKWFRNLPDPKEMLPENWHKIEPEWED